MERSKMPAYYAARAKILDPQGYKKYAELAPAIIDSYGGKMLARGGKYQIIEGTDAFDRFIVIEFPTVARGVACFTSQEYAVAAAFRRTGSGIVESAIVEGC